MRRAKEELDEEKPMIRIFRQRMSEWNDGSKRKV
jgi:hypothetical protein